ncbi:transposon Ty3-I Gag-Pol polyprotein [Trichonephila clavipes]|nr:transposon Ty3-I Gag-Pol polyprotein [Trichonephila clavipes]
MEEKQNCIQTLINKGTAQFCYKKQKMESYIPFTTCRRRQIEKEENISEDYAKKELTTRIARWALQLEEFDYEIEHRAGSCMKHVDALSRYPVMIVCNETLTSKLKKAHEKDDNIQTFKSLLKKQESEEFFKRNGILYKYLNGRELIVTPKATQAELIKLIHENGHFSVGKTEEIVKQESFIPNLTNVVKKVILNCVPCILANKKTGKKEGFLNPFSKENIPLSTYHVDFIGPLPSTNKSYQHIFTVVDAFTKFTWLYPGRTPNYFCGSPNKSSNKDQTLQKAGF